MGQSLKVIEVVFFLQGFKGLVDHLGLLFNIAVAILVVFKTNDDNRFIVLGIDTPTISNGTIIPDLDLEQAVFGSLSVLIELSHQAIKAVLCRGTSRNHDNRR